MSKKRILSGMQSSGKLHLGNLLGALENWKKLEKDYDCFYFIADWHALSTNYEDTREIKSNTFEIAVDWLASGIDPEKSTLFIQSLIPEHAELHLFLSMITPIPWLERNPTYKEKMEEIKNKDLTTYGFLGYPVLQTADIVLYRADYVPVGIDQLPHLELSRELVRRFHHIYKKKVFVEPEAKLSEVPKLPGLDGRKMSKSYDNAIYLSDPPSVIEKKVMTMLTDPQRARRTDPGDPEVSTVYQYHKIFTPKDQVEEIAKGCRTASIGCTDCKKILMKNLVEFLKPHFEKREELKNRPKDVMEIFEQGSIKARKEAQNTLKQVKEAMKI